jgi:hypothetical protein
MNLFETHHFTASVLSNSATIALYCHDQNIDDEPFQ